MYRRIAGIESQRPTARGIKLQHGAYVIREERSSPCFENAANEVEPTKSKWFRADEILGTTKANESRPHLPKQSEPFETLSRFDAELTLKNAPRSTGANAIGSWEIVDHGFKTDPARDIESEPAAQSTLRLRAILTEDNNIACQLPRWIERQRREVCADFKPRRWFLTPVWSKPMGVVFILRREQPERNA